MLGSRVRVSPTKSRILVYEEPMSVLRNSVQSLLCLSVALGTLASPSSAQADGRLIRGERGVDNGRLFAENFMDELCYLDSSTGAGFLTVQVWPLFARVMVERFSGVFTYVGEEACGDKVDNDCDGQVDEDCKTAPAPRRFGNEACDACMDKQCQQRSEACVADKECVQAIECVRTHKCLDPVLGPLGCVCGEGVSVSECQATPSSQRKGACAEQLGPKSVPGGGTQVPLGLFPPRTAKAGFALSCMHRFCKAACSENFNQPKAPVCGDGKVDQGEKCDDGNTQDGDGCSARCEVEPDPSTWLAGADCDACMESECTSEETSCLSDAQCKELIRCPGEKNCVSGTVSLLSCICGEGVSIPQCQADARNDALKGACAEQFASVANLTGEHTPFSQMVIRDTPPERAGRAYYCMVRKCRDRCAENMFDVNKPKAPLCGNGIVEEGEECDDGNQVEGDGCSKDCREGGGPTWGQYAQGARCDACMDSECRNEVEACLPDQTCLGVARCYAQNACLDRRLGAMPCLCGPGVSVLDCQEKVDMAGPCKDKIFSALDLPSNTLPAEVVTQFMRGKVGRANHVGLCMVRRCSEECSHNLLR